LAPAWFKAQLTLTALLLAFGTSQLFWGPLSDKWGRRPILLGGIFVYVISAITCALAPNMEALIAARTLQGVAMGACVMAARAIVRDLYEPTEGARVMSQALSGLGLIACTCVPVGGFLTDWMGWRWALSSLVLFALVTALLIYLYFDESLQQLMGSLCRLYALSVEHGEVEPPVTTRTGIGATDAMVVSNVPIASSRHVRFRTWFLAKLDRAHEQRAGEETRWT